MIVSTFGPEGPTKCSGLEVVRYDANRCTKSLEYTSTYWVVPRNCIKRRLGQRNNSYTVTAGSNSSGAIQLRVANARVRELLFR